jgi:hypothetical protein
MITPRVSDPAVLLAALRATGGMSMQVASPDAVRLAATAAQASGRSPVDCTVSRKVLGDERLGLTRGVTLRWMPQCTPSPEDSHAYPVRVLPVIARLTWACCLGLAWPRRADEPYPGCRFTRAEVVDLAGDLGAGSTWIKAALDHDLIPAGLVIADHSAGPDVLRLGPAAAALPEPFVEAMRRFHDQLPRPAQPPEESDHGADDDMDEDMTHGGGTGWRAGNTRMPASGTGTEAEGW